MPAYVVLEDGKLERIDLWRGSLVDAEKYATKHGVQVAVFADEPTLIVARPKPEHALRCCFQGCEKPAAFEIGRQKPAGPEGENTHGCEDHVGHLLGYVAEPHEGGWWVVEV